MSTRSAPLTARGVRTMLARSGVDLSALTITDDRTVWYGIETGAPSTSVRIEGPKEARDAATSALWTRGLWQAPYSDRDEWSRG